MSTIIQDIERRQLREVPRFKAGDTVRVHFRVIEGTRERIQVFEGLVLKRQGAGSRETFTVRKNSFGVGVERTFPLHSPKIDKIEVQAIGDVNRAKLYYLRGKVGKKARVARAAPELRRPRNFFANSAVRGPTRAAAGAILGPCLRSGARPDRSCCGSTANWACGSSRVPTRPAAGRLRGRSSLRACCSTTTACATTASGRSRS